MNDVLWRQVKVGRKDGSVLYRPNAFAGFDIEGFDGLNLIAEEGNAVATINIGQVNINRIALYPERSPA